ncbi:MAG: flagellin, partial [Phycisphaerae bacterium]|nr:flagellin [Phycisphaerae bacterium]
DGADVRAKVTELTELADLRAGAGIDPSGLIITNGSVSRTIDLSSAVTVQDLLNAINSSGTNVRAEINAEGTAIHLLNPTQGIHLTIGENGGDTATQLGLRSFGPATSVNEINFGAGLRTVEGDDLIITDSSGVSFGVDLDGVSTIQDVMDRITTAAGGAGAGVAVSFATTGNGIVLTDTAGGSGTLTVANAPFSKAADDLGLTKPAVGGVINGDDVNAVASTGVFANLIALQKALRSSDQRAITSAAERLKADYDRMVRVRGEAGARLRELETRRERIEDQTVVTQKLLAEIEDVDFTEAVTRLQSLQTALQATLQSAGLTLNLSLLDFLA